MTEPITPDPMTETTQLEAKVLLLEHDPTQCRQLSSFCHEVGLLPLLRTSHDALRALEEHKDLAGVLLAEDLPCGADDGLVLALAIHRQRPELPIFLRRTADKPLSVAQAQAIRFAWKVGELEQLRASVDRAIFSLRYPAELVQGIIDLTCQAMRSMFPNAHVDAEAPYVVHDRIIHGEVSTIIPIESTWCRGFMMLQTEESALRQGMVQGFSFEGMGGDLNFRELNNMLGETTNLIWGAFKNRYIPPEAFANQQTQVPIVINHAHKYISFGSPDPQLCIRYQLTDPARPELVPLVIVQRFIFNLLWSPEAFSVYSAASSASTVATGELDLF
ncbi:chemotaxis protein CheX [Curvibacter sp. CHRR-16]|uniref:chemotaxis protein CheX n=1 Tax=Curvibacter sp. CHRR-16 TaxID=2835872 RepID=UPI001BD9B2F6|nr:chemotaxis protein CheX [Curvibacter sp. CHRR-16]MBT0570622.1 chemotaxis protein CheX [Curvibacter sp. CHRR-16]